MSFEQFLKTIVGDRPATLLDVQKAFSVIATIYIEDSLNLVSEATLPGKDGAQILARADAIFYAWEHELLSLKTTVKALPGFGGSMSVSTKAKMQSKRKIPQE